MTELFSQFFSYLERVGVLKILIVVLGFVVGSVVVVRFFCYVHRLLERYSTLLREVFEHNKGKRRIIHLEYSWLKGVKLTVIPLPEPEKDKPEQNP